MQLFFWIIAIVLSFGAGYWVYRADVRRAVPYPWITAALRMLVVLLVLLLLLAPTITVDRQEIQKPVIVFLQDNSASIPLGLKKDTTLYRKQAEQLIDRLSADYKVVKWGFGNAIQHDTLFDYRQQATDITTALSQAVAFYGEQNLGGIILATDGRFNQGMHPLFEDLPYTGVLYTVALGDSMLQKDLRIANVYANKTVTLNSQFEIRADVVANACAGYTGTIQLQEAGGGSFNNTSINITGDKFDKAVSFTLKADRAGMHHYVITASAADGEQNTVNNRKDVFVEVVSEKKNILIASATPHPDINALREALNGLEEFSVTVKSGDNIPSDLSAYQIVIFYGLPSSSNVLQQLSGRQKATWFIVSSGANNNVLNQMQTAVKLNVNTFNLQNLFVTTNTSFNTFTLPQNIHAVMDKMPPLAVPAGMIQVGAGAEVLFTARNNQQLPLWALQRGKTPVAVLIGEGLWRWRLFEYRYFNTHNTVDELIRQTVSFLSVNNNDLPFQVVLPKYVWSDQEAVSINAYLLNESREQVNSADAFISISDSSGNKQQYSLERSGNAYRLNIGLKPAGTYNYIARTNYNGKSYTASGSFVVQHLPLEQMETGADYPMLHTLSKKYQGILIPYQSVASLYDSIRNNKSIKPVLQHHTETIPLIDWKWYFFLLLLFAIAEWLLRKYWMAQ